MNLCLSRNDDFILEVFMYIVNEDGIIKEDIKDDYVLFILFNFVF